MHTFYKFAIHKVRDYIKDNPAGSFGCIDAFAFSTVLAVVFDKSKEEVISDIVML